MRQALSGEIVPKMEKEPGVAATLFGTGAAGLGDETMVNLFGKLFGGDKNDDGDRFARFMKEKEQALEAILGPMDEMVFHALIPFDAGGQVDVYCFSQFIPGTVCVTMEMFDEKGKGIRKGRLGSYELAVCTRMKNSQTDKPFSIPGKDSPNDPFVKTVNHINGIMTTMGQFGRQAVLNPLETAEVPYDDTRNLYFIFDEFDTRGKAFEIAGRRHGLLLVMEVFESELRFAREHSCAELIGRLKEAGVYPYTDMDREAVV